MRGSRSIGPLLKAAALCSAVCLLASGCGASGTPKVVSPGTPSTPASTGPQRATLTAKGRYERAMQLLGGTLGSSLRLAGEIELAAAGKKSAAVKDATALKQARVALRSAAIRLGRIKPPPEIRAAHALLVRAVKEYADELGGVISRLEAGGAPVTVLQEILRFRGVKDMQRASIQIAKKGYSIVAG
jgi:hypothetical protein